MVIQRNAKGQSDAVFSGECKQEGNLLAAVAQKGRAKKPIVVGKASHGKFQGRLRGIRAGGPYTITLLIQDKSGAVAEKMMIDNVLVGDLWVLAGQSNMAGYGLVKKARKPMPMVRAFYMNERWDVAKDPINVPQHAVDPVHAYIDGGVVNPPSLHTGTGPGVAFAQEMYAITGVPQGVIASAHGGTSMAQWNPAIKDQPGKSLYGAMLKRLQLNGGRAAGIVWYQGCSDTTSVAEPFYTENMEEFVRASRKDFNDPKLPFVAVQISRVCGRMTTAKYWNAIQEQQRRLPRKIKNLAVVSAIDLSLDDPIHISGEDAHRVGTRCARAMSFLNGLGKGFLASPTIKGIRAMHNPATGTADVYVQFNNISKGLRAPGRPSGFSISDSPSEITNDFIYRIDLEGDTAILRTMVPNHDIEGKYLYYGFGHNPYCNIVDGQDNALPFMGPLVIGRERALSPYITTWRVSKFLPSAGKLESLQAPANIANLDFKEIRFAEKQDPYYLENFCNLHAEILPTAPADAVVFYECTMHCSGQMDLDLLLGYDGPVKAWFDGRMVFHDPNGTNPATASKGVVPLKAISGEHRLLVALGTNNANAWGIFARVERKDVVFTKDRPAGFVMPEFR